MKGQNSEWDRKPCTINNPLLTTTGPGDYDPEKPQTSLSYSIPAKTRSPTDLGMPGPGQYDNNKKSKFIPGAGLGKSPRGKGKIYQRIY